MKNNIKSDSVHAYTSISALMVPSFLEAVTGFVAGCHEIDDNYFAHGGKAHGELILWDVYDKSD